MDEPEDVLRENGIKWDSIEKGETGADESRRNYVAETENGNYHVSFQKDRETPINKKTVEQKIKAEVYSYRKIGEETPIRTPEVINYSDKYILTEEIEGAPTIQIFRDRARKNREKIAKELGEKLAEIHEIKTEKTGYLGPSGVEKTFDSWIKFFQPMINDVVEGAETRQEKQAADYLEKNIELLDISIEPVLVYGDFQPWNTLTEEGMPIGLIDGESSFSGHREYDLAQAAVAWSDKFDVTESFLKGYRSKSSLEECWKERHEYYKTYLFASAIISARAVGWDSLVEEFKERLEYHLKIVS